jgi:hypothetical protein
MRERVVGQIITFDGVLQTVAPKESILSRLFGGSKGDVSKAASLKGTPGAPGSGR